MPLDTSIALQGRQFDPAEAYSKAMTLRNMAAQNELHGLQGQQMRQQMERQGNLHDLLGGMPAGVSDDQRISSLRGSGYFDEADKLQTGILARDKSRADTAHVGAQTSELGLKNQATGMQYVADSVKRMLSRQDLSLDTVLAELAQSPPAMREEAAAFSRILSPDPRELRQQLMTVGLSAQERLKAMSPDLEMVNFGGSRGLVDKNSMTRGNAPTSYANTMTPDSIATNATSRANNRDTIAGENMRAGFMPGGGTDENSERTAQAIASGQLPPPTGMALLNPRNQRVLGRVMEINPDYDATTVSAKKAAATAFTTGKEGAMMRSLQVAGQHLGQLDTLIDAMNNGNTQLVNKIGNAYSQQTGSPAITNFDAAKQVVAKEVMKAIVAGGGGVGEREELAHSMENAKSPAQLRGVTQQYRNLMAAQHDALLQQRDAAGLPRSTLPKYTEGEPATAPPTNLGARPPISAFQR